MKRTGIAWDFERRSVQLGLGQQLLEPAALVFQRLELAGVRDLHPAITRPPLVEGCVTDPRYAAPEVMYAKETDAELRKFEARRRIDIYHLGSMIYFLVTGRMLTPEIIRRLPPEQRPPEDVRYNTSDYSCIIPYWRDAFGRVLAEFRSKLPTNDKGELTAAGKALLDAMIQLTDPDPALRGHPHNRTGHNDPMSVQQYITLFESLRRRAMH